MTDLLATAWEYSGEVPGDVTAPAAAPLSLAQRALILEHWSGPEYDPQLGAPALLGELFTATALRYPEHTALECGPCRLTYAQLDREACRVSRYLRACGVKVGDRVALQLPRSESALIVLLGILKTGAAYVPLDPEYPQERVAYILQDSQARALVTLSDMPGGGTTYQGLRIDWDTLNLDTPRAGVRWPSRPARPDDIAYIIYTSGSTGRPKGVPITHTAACNLVRAEGRIFQVRPEDRVYQGFSLAFDASVEEVWLAWYSGAALVVGTSEMVHAGPGLAELLTERKITVFSTVPTLLALLGADLPSVRLLILGGETCPADLVQRWGTPGRRMVNTYGPTEATVIATYSDCVPGQALTIGRAVDNYKIYILAPEGVELVPPGVAGELCIAGPGLSPGYLGRPDLTREKFIPNPFRQDPPYERIYRTGDLAQWSPTGEVIFCGRLDAQVKIRGFRVELTEIEAALRGFPGVRAAAVTTHELSAGVPHLVAYLVTEAAELDLPALKTQLRQTLPGYMVPTRFEFLAALPILPSGKVNRKALPAPEAIATGTADDPPQGSWETRLAESWQRWFAVPINRTAHFFTDLGGHSLLAARMVSELRTQANFATLSVLDVYHHPVLAQLAAALAKRAPAGNVAEPIKPTTPTSAAARARAAAAGHAHRQRHTWCSWGQLGAMYPLIAFYSLQWIAPYLVYTYILEHYSRRLWAVTGALGVVVGVIPTMLMGAIVFKWLMLGKVRPGKYPLWGNFYFRWWLVQRVLGAVPADYLTGTPLARWFYRALGVRIGAQAYIGTDQIGAFDVISIGDRAAIGMHAALLGYTIEHGFLEIGPITVGADCHVGAGATLCPHTVMEPKARLGYLSLLPRHSTIPGGAAWYGAPALPLEHPTSQLNPVGIRPQAQAAPLPDWGTRTLYAGLHALGCLLIPVIYLAAMMPGLLMLTEASQLYGPFNSLWMVPPAALAFILILGLEIVVVKWLLLGRVEPGEYPLYSSFYVRKWFVDQLMDLSLDILGPMYATLYLNPWYRALGAKLGARAEISTACATSPDLLELGRESFVADAVSLGVPSVDQGVLSLNRTTIGERAFIGNSALLPAGSEIGHSSLIGVLSVPPLSTPGARQTDTSWLGCPALFLPQRQHTQQAFADSATFNPTPSLYAQRLSIELLRVTLPLTFFVMLASILISLLVITHGQMSWPAHLLLFPLLYGAAGVVAAGLVIAAKWVLIGRYVPQEKPLWSTFVWRSELLNALHEYLAKPFLIDMFVGTSLLGWFYRLLGMDVGRRVLFDSSEFTEFDLVHLGDDVILNAECTIQTHLFEDRVMKMSTITLEANVSIGANAVVLYDTHLGQDVVLEDLSLVMKGESLPAHTRWQGSPAGHVAV